MPFKLNLGIQTLKSDSTQAVIFINHIDGRFSALDYYDPSLLRQKISDTVLITRGEFSDLAGLLWEMGELQEDNNPVPITDHFFSIMIKDRELSFAYSSFNESLKGSGEAVNAILALFEKYFPVIPLWSADSKIALRKNEKNLETVFELIQSKDDIFCKINDKSKFVSKEAYLNIWSVLESNQVWTLPADKHYQGFPLSYHISIQRGGEKAEWIVYAPHLLSDKRYYSIVNIIETQAY